MEEEKKLPQGLSIAGMVLGIVGLVFSLGGCTALVGIICGVVGIILSGIAFKKCGEGTQGGKGMAIAGLATGIIAVLYGIYVFMVVAAVVNEIDKYNDFYDSYGY